MSCIVGIVQGDQVWMGADGVASFGEARLRMKNRKMFRRAFPGGEMLIGVSGAPRVAQIMEYSFTPPDHATGVDALAYLCSEFAPALAAKLEEFKRWTPDKDESEPTIVTNTHFLVAYKERLFLFDGALTAYEVENGYEAVGSGSEVAVGYLRGAMEWDPANGLINHAERLALGALNAAAEFQRGVGGPFHIEKL